MKNKNGFHSKKLMETFTETHSVPLNRNDSETQGPSSIDNPFQVTHPAPFDTMGLFTFLRTYARRHNENDPNSTVESWEQALERVITACNTQLKVGFSSAEQKELFNLLYDLKCSVAGRFLWQLGTKTVDTLGMPSLQNCCFTVVDEPVYPFTWVMNMLMLGSGCVIPSTPILTFDGIKPISLVKVGDMVLSYNSKTSVAEYKKVLYTHKVIVPREKNVRITTKHSRVVTSIEHPFLVRRNNEWEFVCAKELKLNDRMRRYQVYEPESRTLNENAHLIGTRERHAIPPFIKNCYDKNLFMSFLCGLLDMDGFTSPGVMIYSTRFDSMINDLLDYQDMYDLCMQPVERMSVTENYKVSIPLHKLWNYADFFHSKDKKEFLLNDRRKRELLSRPLTTRLDKITKTRIVGNEEYISTMVSGVENIEEVDDEIIELEYGLPYNENFCDITVEDNNSYYTGEGGQVVSHNCGFRILPEDIDKLPPIKHSVATRLDTKDADYIVPDSREGWIKLLGKVLKAHFYSGENFTYSCLLLRSKGAPIKGFGGLASGPEVLCEGLAKIDEILNKRAGQVMRPIDALDVMNICGMIVVSGNIRRCLPKGSLVHTSKGLVPIEQLKVNDKVLTPTGYHNVNNVFVQGVQQTVLIKTEQGLFECTPNHRMAVISGNTYEYKEASSLKEGDQLATCRLATGGEQQQIIIDGKTSVFDEELAWIIGYMRSDDHLRYFSCEFGEKAFHRVYTRMCCLNEKMSTPFEFFRDEYGLATVRFNDMFKLVYASPPSVRLAFVTGIVDRYRSHRDVSNNEDLIMHYSEAMVESLQALFYSCGIETKITGGRENVHYRPQPYVLSLASEYAVNEFWTNPYVLSRSMQKKEGMFGHTFSMNPVKVIGLMKSHVSVETFDIEVDQVHEFFCNGYLTHNSALISMGDCKDQDYLRAKRWDLGNVPNHRAYSNNSVVCNDINEILDNEEFWAGYNGGGEPYGLINLDLSRKCGRLGDTRYPDPNVEGYNPCLAIDTWILTTDGPRQISDLIGRQTCIVNNGKSYSTTEKGFWKTGEQMVYTIETNEGFMIRATGNHQFMSEHGWIEVQNMRAGDELALHEHKNVIWGGNGTFENGSDVAKKAFNSTTSPTFDSTIERNSSEFYRGFVFFLSENSEKEYTEDDTFLHMKFGDKNSACLVQRMLLRMGRYSSFYKQKNEYVLIVNFWNNATFVATVKSITPDKVIDVYDCTVPKVNSFDANGFYVHNCAEQSLNNMESCCLGELFLPNIKSEEELKKCATYIYRICKHSLRLPCKDSPGMEAVVHKNMRMGIGITGYLQATEEKRKWLPACYEYLRQYDVEYSAKHNFPISIKLTTCKPSGTLSLLGGVTSGVHPAYSQYYIRRIRISSNSPLISIARKHGYPIEYARNFDGTNIHDTQIISFPHMVPLGTVLAENCTAISQLEWVKRLQTEWSDNSVSVTVYYRKEELPAIKQWLKENYNNSVKTVSFLLHNDHGFDQAPLEQITKEQYEELASKCKPITSTAGVCYTIESEEMISQQECAGGVCPMR